MRAGIKRQCCSTKHWVLNSLEVWILILWCLKMNMMLISKLHLKSENTEHLVLILTSCHFSVIKCCKWLKFYVRFCGKWCQWFMEKKQNIFTVPQTHCLWLTDFRVYNNNNNNKMSCKCKGQNSHLEKFVIFKSLFSFPV